MLKITPKYKPKPPSVALLRPPTWILGSPRNPPDYPTGPHKLKIHRKSMKFNEIGPPDPPALGPIPYGGGGRGPWDPGSYIYIYTCMYRYIHIDA